LEADTAGERSHTCSTENLLDNHRLSFEAYHFGKRQNLCEAKADGAVELKTWKSPCGIPFMMADTTWRTYSGVDENAPFVSRSELWLPLCLSISAMIRSVACLNAMPRQYVRL